MMRKPSRLPHASESLAFLRLPSRAVSHASAPRPNLIALSAATTLFVLALSGSSGCSINGATMDDAEWFMFEFEFSDSSIAMNETTECRLIAHLGDKPGNVTSIEFSIIYDPLIIAPVGGSARLGAVWGSHAELDVSQADGALNMTITVDNFLNSVHVGDDVLLHFDLLGVNPGHAFLAFNSTQILMYSADDLMEIEFSPVDLWSNWANTTLEVTDG